MTDIVWNPGWRQLLVPCLAHGVAIGGVTLALPWLPQAGWLVPLIVLSLGVDTARAYRSIGRCRQLRIVGSSIVLREADGWRTVDAEDPWLGPGIIVLRVRSEAGRRWWLWRHEIGSRDDAELRRALRFPSARDGL